MRIKSFAILLLLSSLITSFETDSINIKDSTIQTSQKDFSIRVDKISQRTSIAYPGGSVYSGAGVFIMVDVTIQNNLDKRQNINLSECYLTMAAEKVKAKYVMKVGTANF
ncbi:MAG: hypothetical protein ACJA0U_000460 [Salibacteraceae bacterium]|jgi:hypothetical protein